MPSSRHKSIKKPRLFWIVSLGVLAAIGGVLWSRFGRRPAIRHVLLISIDTCRADYLGCYGFDRPITPRIDQLAREGLLFKNAHTPSPMTLPAHCSMLTGTYQPYHQVHENYDYRLAESHLTLAELLKDNGLATGAVVSSFVLDRRFGTDQGFDLYNDQFEEPVGGSRSLERRGEEASRFACEFLARHAHEPFFLFLHYFDPHDEYIPPEPFASRFADNLYAGEIAYVDRCIGLVIDRLKELGLYDSTLIVLVGDHGEALGEHEESTHGYYIYQSTIHVPFIIKVPRMNRSKVIEEPVCLVDVVPTILGYLGKPIPSHVQGIDLSGFSRSAPPDYPDRALYSESLTPTKFGCNPLLGVIQDRWNYIHTSRPELYDLQLDRGQLDNQAFRQPQRVLLMSSRLEEMILGLVGAGSVESRWELDPETRRRLESLGYVGDVPVMEGLSLDPNKKDPKDRLRYYEAKQTAARLMDRREYQPVRRLCEQMIAHDPQLPDAYLLLMRIAFETEDFPDALEQGRRILALKDRAEPFARPEDEAFHTNLLTNVYSQMAQAALTLENYELVAEFCQKYLEIKPESPVSAAVRNTLGWAYFQIGQQEKAFSLWVELIQSHPTMAEAYENIGLALHQLGRNDQAITYLNQGLKLDPTLRRAQEALNSLLRIKQLDSVISQLHRMLQQQPDNPDLHQKLADACYQAGYYPEAIAAAEKALQLAVSASNEPLAQKLRLFLKTLKSQ